MTEPGYHITTMESSVCHSGVSFRRAGPEDYENVMKINENIYNGFDYLPNMYHKYLDHQRRGMFVAEIDHKVVSFLSSCLVDAGQSLVITAARTHPDLQGRGIFRALRRHVVAEVKKFNPSVRRLVGTYTPPEDLSHDANDVEYKRHFLIIHNSLDELLQRLLEHTADVVQEVQHLSPDVARALLQKPEVRHLFPNNHVMVSYWIPFRLIEENLDDIVSNNGVHVFVSKDKKSDQIHAVSFLSFLETKNGIEFYVSFYGDSILHCKAHLREHFAFVKGSCNDQLLYIVFKFPIDLDKGELRAFFTKELNGEEYKSHSNLMVIFKNQSIDGVLSHHC